MIAAIKAQTDALEKLPQAIAMAVAEAMKAVQPPVIEVVAKAPETAVVSLVNDLPREDLPKETTRVALPSKDELARQWLAEHPTDRELTGRELEATRNPMGVKISYVTWNKAKKHASS